MGFVVKKALVTAHERSAYYANILDQTKGIAFLGVPHRGSGIARLGNYLARLLSTASLGTSTNPKLLQDLRRNSETLINLSLSSNHRLTGLQLLSFYETQQTDGIQIVDRESAILGRGEEMEIAVDANHRTICKFASEDDPAYRTIGRRLGRLIQSVASKTKPKQLGLDSQSPVASDSTGCV